MRIPRAPDASTDPQKVIARDARWSALPCSAPVALATLWSEETALRRAAPIARFVRADIIDLHVVDSRRRRRTLRERVATRVAVPFSSMSKKKKGPGGGGGKAKSKHRFSFAKGPGGKDGAGAARDKPSAFETRSNAPRKFDIMGRVYKGEKHNIIAARAAGNTKRKNTLLKEYRASNKANAFVDRRFGEGDATLTPEERQIGRLTRTRLRQLGTGRGGKKSFALGDDDDGNAWMNDGDGGDDADGGTTLTHGGVAIDEATEKRRSEHHLARRATTTRRSARDGFGGSDSDDDFGGGMDRAITGALHFGGGEGNGDDDDGGFEPSLKRGDHGVDGDDDGGERRKTKAEVMTELIEKSKYHKALKTRQREADEDLLDKLDGTFAALSGDGAFRAVLSKGVGHLKPDGWTRDGNRRDKKNQKGETNAAAPSGIDLDAKAKEAGEVVKDDYDKITRALALEARGRAADRTRTQEEIDAAEAAKLEEAERGRLKRQRAGDSDDDVALSDGDDDGMRAGGGYAARRAKSKGSRAKDDDGDDGAKKEKKKARKDGRIGGDDLGDDFAVGSDGDDDDDGKGGGGAFFGGDPLAYGSSSEEEGDVEGLDAKEAERRAMTKSLKREVGSIKDLERGKKRLRKLGLLDDGGDAGEDEEDDGDDDDGDDDDDQEDDDDDDDDEEEEEEDEEEEEEDEEKKVADDVDDKSDIVSIPDNSDTSISVTPSDEDAGGAESDSDPAARSKKTETASSPPRPTSTSTELPFTFPMPETPEQLNDIVGALSPADTALALERIRKCHAPTLKEDNRKKTQTFLGLLLQRFEVLAGESPLPAVYLDILAANVAAVAASVPFFAATAARARLEKMSARLRAALRDDETGWPPARTILLLALFAEVFPTTDKQHPVCTPAALYIGNVLAHCAIRGAREAALAVVFGALAAAYRCVLSHTGSHTTPSPW